MEPTWVEESMSLGMVQAQGYVMKQLGLDARHCDKNGTIGFNKGSDDHVRLMDVLDKLDDEMSQLIRETTNSFPHPLSGPRPPEHAVFPPPEAAPLL
ncbi:hypothetical protein SAMN05444161_5699 [Rhizobiales bacterium GAS191]|jgi:hypothetical protein|nr:hypothetical protein SAMN05519103_04895 [Rhizobiales bacterium GAS113]SEE41814.1 hypothetical protein SAMN05444161_5699 [Rhizobiales bacterium GAS191]